MLCCYWARIEAKEGHYPVRSCDTIRNYVEGAPDALERIPCKEFDEMLATPSTAPGPDGQNRCVCRFAGSIGGEILLDAYRQAILSSGQLAGHSRFKASHLFLFVGHSVSINFLVLLW